MDDFIDMMIAYLEQIPNVIDELSDEEMQLVTQFMQEAFQFIQEEQTARPLPSEAPIPLGADILWEIANGDPDVFQSYLRTVPDPHLRILAANPAQVQNLINQLSQQFPPSPPTTEAGIEKAPLNSSNIWGFHYNPHSGHLLVRFQGGSVYAYEGVPPQIFRIFSQGAVPAKTDGQNAYGKWWVGKIPSLGAAFYELIRGGGYPYEQVA